MEHKKNHNQLEKDSPYGKIIVESPVPSERFASYTFDEGLVAFRPASRQHAALIEVAKQPEARMTIARIDDVIIGYAAFSYPDPLERWAEGNLERLLVLGAVEVSPNYRGAGLGKALLEVTMMDEAVENYIIITTEYYWHWDLKSTGLNVWDYRRMMEKMMNHGGLMYTPTDDPEICSHPANCLMVRIGRDVDQHTIDQFDRLRFARRYATYE